MDFIVNNLEENVRYEVRVSYPAVVSCHGNMCFHLCIELFLLSPCRVHTSVQLTWCIFSYPSAQALCVSMCARACPCVCLSMCVCVCPCMCACVQCTCVCALCVYVSASVCTCLLVCVCVRV